jgi:hypothetical protein
MAQVIAITDDSGKVLGVLRGDPIEVGDGMTIQAVARPVAGYRHHTLEVPDDLLGRLASEVHREVQRRLAE